MTGEVLALERSYTFLPSWQALPNSSPGQVPHMENRVSCQDRIGESHLPEEPGQYVAMNVVEIK